LIREYGSGRYKQILFTDEKIFTIEQSFNKRNDRVYGLAAHTKLEGRFPEFKGVTIRLRSWYGGAYCIKVLLVFLFLETGVKTTANVYQTMLEDVLKSPNHTQFKNKHWVFRQDSALAHKAKTTQQWLEKNVPDVIRAENWPSDSPDLNPLDYRLW